MCATCMWVMMYVGELLGPVMDGEEEDVWIWLNVC